jgi:hypothetical protein
MKWSDIDTSTFVYAGKRGGGTKITNADGTPVRFQIPTGRVMYNGLSDFKSMTLEMPSDFVQWWTDTIDTIASESTPFRSNVKDNGLRVKVDGVTQFFDESKKSIFPTLDEGVLKGETLTCIIEVSGVYYFQDTYGLIVRAHQVVVRKSTAAATADVVSDQLKGFAFI